MQAEKNKGVATVKTIAPILHMKILVFSAPMTPLLDRSLSARRRIGKPFLPASFLCMLAALGVLAGGCTTPPRATTRAEYVLAARYELGGHRPAADHGVKLQRDLQMYKSLGFNSILFDYVDDSQRTRLLDAASQIGLRAYLTDRDLHYYLLTGKLRGAASLESLIAERIQPLSRHSAFAGVAILSGYPKERASAVFAALEAAGIKCLVPGQGGYASNRGAVVSWLDTNEVSHSNVSQIERLLLELNGEIYSGWNDGLVIDFAPDPRLATSSSTPPENDRREGQDLPLPLPPDDESEPLARETPSQASTTRSRVFAVESLLSRARLWGARLQGFDRQLIRPDGLRRDSAVLTAVFERDARRYLFLFNQSSQPVRGPIRLPAMLGSRPVLRAVGIPATADRIAGDVFEVRGPELAVNVNLRPGDAALFELF